METITAYAAALGIGLSLGLIGAGGSILTIPVFVYVLKKDPLESSVYSMFVVGISALTGSMLAFINKLVDLKTAILFGVPSIAGVYLARQFIFPAIPGELFSIGSFKMGKDGLFMLCLAALMFFAAFRMLKPINTEPGIDQDKPSILQVSLRGMMVGIITGLLGIGGGFLIVPALYLCAKLPVKKAIGTALLIIAANSLFSFLNSYLSITIDWLLILKFSIGAIVGILLGTRLSAKMPGAQLKKIFGCFIFSISIYIIYRQFYL